MLLIEHLDVGFIGGAHGEGRNGDDVVVDVVPFCGEVVDFGEGGGGGGREEVVEDTERR